MKCQPNYSGVKTAIYLITFTLGFLSTEAQVKVVNLLCENLKDPIGIDVLEPRMSWQIVSNKRDVIQTAYEIRVSKSEISNSEKNEFIWSTGKITSDSSVYVVYQGPTLKTNCKYYWQVRIWNNKDEVSNWSDPSFWEMGILNKSDWKAHWIEQGFPLDTTRPSPLFRKTFNIRKTVKSATAYITALGLYNAIINGSEISDTYFDPGWTDYKKRLQYQAFDVTNLLKQGKNAIGVSLGDGWYKRFYIGKDPKLALLFQINIEFSDGTETYIVSDTTWKCSTGEVRKSEIFDGGIFDARKKKEGWADPKYDEREWSHVIARDSIDMKLIGTLCEPIRAHEKLKVKKIFTTPKGEKVIDFGQMLAGWVRFRVSGNAGDTVKIFHSDVLDKSGNFYTKNLWGEKEDVYVLNGKGAETFEPQFTYQGFRYIKVEGYPGQLKPENFIAVALYSDMEETGEFRCSDSLVNRLQQNIKWTQKGTFFSVPAATSDRDERLGWDDTQLFSSTAAFNMRVNNFYAKWLWDLREDQLPDGKVPLLFPNVADTVGGVAGWGDAATIVPWNVYLSYGDKRLLRSQYSSMKAWLGYIGKHSTNNLWNVGFPWWTYGDWLFYTGADPSWTGWGPPAPTDIYLIAQCYYANSIQIVIDAAKALNKSDDVLKYSKLLRLVKNAFMNEYVTKSGRLISGTQTAYVLALKFNMYPDSMRHAAAEKLVGNITDYHYHLSTGELGAAHLCSVLTSTGYADTAYKVFLQRSYPSWLYPVTMGATSIWERWDTIKPDTTFSNPIMNSFDIPQLGSVGNWLYTDVAGINTYSDGAGYKHIKIKPYIPKQGLTFAEARLETYYGEVYSHWQKTEEGLILDVDIPPNTKATIYIPAENLNNVYESSEKVATRKTFVNTDREKGYVLLEVGSGNYHFKINDN